MDILTIANLKKRFGDKEVLKGVSLSVPEKSVFGFIGKNGAGKTTTMKAVLGLLQADEGEIYVAGEKVAYGQTKTNRHIGYLPDVPEFYDFMTPREYLMLCGSITGMSKKVSMERTEELLEMVILSADMLELKANPNRMAKGTVIESRLDKGRGPVATVLVQNGTLNNGDIVVAGTAVGRIRVMTDYRGRRVKEAGPSVPVEIVGLDDVPQAGDELNAVEDERMAKALAEERREKQRQEILNANARVSLDDIFNQMAEGVKTLNIVVKADVAGSAEAVKASWIIRN